MRKLTFYMNRAGSNLKPRDTGRLNNAKVKLAHLYGRNPPAGARKKRRKAKRK